MNSVEDLLKAKIPGKETNIEIKRSMCDICSPGMQCGLDVFVKDGVILKVEGTEGFVPSNGKLCTKGAANRQFVYREDRIKTPLKRVGKRGEGKFEPISWDESLETCAEAFNKTKAQYGPEAVVWLTGYSKWYRPWLHRLAHSFGSENYITESSTCHTAEVMSYKTLFGHLFMPDMKNAKSLISWGSNGVMNAHVMGRGLFEFKDRGGKMVVIDPRHTHVANKMADLYLRPRIGTDGALAHAMAKVIIEENRIDREFIDKYVHGFDQYVQMVKEFDLSRTERETGVPSGDIVKAIDIFLNSDPSTIIPGNGLTHRANGYNNHRAILSLLAITGRVDRPGTILPEYESICHSNGGFKGLEEEYIGETRPKGCKPSVGSERFPLWADMVDEGQGMDLVRHITEGTPYPIRSIAMFGVNDRMYLESGKFLKAIAGLDFVMATDIFSTDVCGIADIVLPVLTSLERSEVKCYAGQFVNWTRPAIEPVYDGRDDVAIITDLAQRMELDDGLLKKGYDAGAQYILSLSGITDWEAVKDSPLPVRAPNAAPHPPGEYINGKILNPSGKIELYSERIVKYADCGLNPLPVYTSGFEGVASDPEEYPMVLMAGARLPNTIHSRGHDVPWLRYLRSDPAADISHADARRLGISQGDDIHIVTGMGHIEVKANITELVNVGEVSMIHGYKEANVNGIIPDTLLDPYTGFPGYKQVRCRIEKAEVGR